MDIFATISGRNAMVDVLYYLKDKQEVFSLNMNSGDTLVDLKCTNVGAYPVWHDAYGTYQVGLSNGMKLALDSIKSIKIYKPILKDYVPSTGVVNGK